MDDPLANISYRDLEQLLRELPATWYPALLVALIEGAYTRNVWRPGKVQQFVANIESRILEKHPNQQEEKNEL